MKKISLSIAAIATMTMMSSLSANTLSEALINAARGNIDNGLIFCGANAYRINKMMSVKELLDELIV